MVAADSEGRQHRLDKVRRAAVKDLLAKAEGETPAGRLLQTLVDVAMWSDAPIAQTIQACETASREVLDLFASFEDEGSPPTEGEEA